MAVIENIKLDNQNLEIADKTARIQIAGLANVAKTGSYNDLKDKPTIPGAPTFNYNETAKSLEITPV